MCICDMQEERSRKQVCIYTHTQENAGLLPEAGLEIKTQESSSQKEWLKLQNPIGNVQRARRAQSRGQNLKQLQILETLIKQCQMKQRASGCKWEKSTKKGKRKLAKNVTETNKHLIKGVVDIVKSHKSSKPNTKKLLYIRKCEDHC